MPTRRVFISGSTGYLGRPLVAQLISRGHEVLALTRPASSAKVPRGAQPVNGDALKASTFQADVTGCDTFVHLTGVAHPAPWKGPQFRAIDLVSLRASATAARAASVNHFVYVSVAHPAPIMKDYIQVRQECEATIRTQRLLATILRPWYVVGPGHRWPIALKPFYRLLERIPATREAALRLGLVTHAEMLAALVWAVEHPPIEHRVLSPTDIRQHSRS